MSSIDLTQIVEKFAILGWPPKKGGRLKEPVIRVLQVKTESINEKV